MRRYRALSVCLVGLSALPACGPFIPIPRVILHDQQAAAKSASEFADLAFVRADVFGARESVSPQMRAAMSAKQFEDGLTKIHPASRPSEVTAIEFEPIPGQHAMNIYLRGTREDESFYYRLLMLGDRGSGYKVGGFWRGSGPYPPSARRPL